MTSRSEENLLCPICFEIFKDPVLLSCSHSFCKACWERWRTEMLGHGCPVCKRKSLFHVPPKNLALKNLCEAFSVEKDQRRSKALCSLHSEDLKLFCLNHQQPVCVICLHSSSHTNHGFRPIDEAAQDYRAGLRELLKPLQEKLELFNDIKGNFDQTAEDIEAQAQDTERQIRSEFLMLQKFLQKEEQVRILEVSKEKTRKSRIMKRKTEALSKEIAALSDTVRATEKVLRAEDLSFLQNYNSAALVVGCFQLKDPQPIQEGLIDTAKHLNNLPFAILDSIKKMIPTSKVVEPKTNPDPVRYSPQKLDASAYRSELRDEFVPMRPISALPMTNETRRLDLTGHKPNFQPPKAPLKGLNVKKQTVYNMFDDLLGTDL